VERREAGKRKQEGFALCVFSEGSEDHGKFPGFLEKMFSTIGGTDLASGIRGSYSGVSSMNA
jgi:hypothetical protein